MGVNIDVRTSAVAITVFTHSHPIPIDEFYDPNRNVNIYNFLWVIGLLGL